MFTSIIKRKDTHRRRLTYSLCNLCLVLICVWPIWALQAKSFAVNTSLDTTDNILKDGNCADSAGRCSLRAAIQESNALAGPDTITLGGIEYLLTISGRNDDLAVTGDLDITDNVSIIGTGKDSTFINANQLDRVFHILGGTVTISNITVHGGRSSRGGGIFVAAPGQLTISDCIITDNRNDGGLYLGGGIYNGFWLSVERCNFNNNWAYNPLGDSNSSQGGAIYNAQDSTAFINNSTMTFNISIFGGGVFHGIDASTTLNGATLNGNYGILNGGAIAATYGGGVIQLINSTISGNFSYDQAGGVSVTQTVLQIANSTIAGNTSTNVSGIINDGTMNIANSIIAFNISENGVHTDCLNSGVINSLGFNIIGSGNGCASSFAPSDQVGTLASPLDPMLAPLLDNGGYSFTHALLPGSPAIDSGNPAIVGSGGSACEAQDQRGITRINGDRCDIGAYEQVGGADLWVTMEQATGSEAVTGELSLFILIGNDGPNDANKPSLRITLPNGGESLNATGEGWDCAAVTNTITCDRLSVINSEQSSLVVSVLLPNDVSAVQINALIDALTSDPQLSNNQSVVSIDVETSGGNESETGADENSANSEPDNPFEPEDATESDSQDSGQLSNEALISGNPGVQPNSSLYAGNWPHDWNSVGRLLEENRDQADRSKHKSKNKNYNQAWLSMDRIRLSENNLHLGIFAAGAVSLIVAGIAIWYLQLTTLFGLFFSYPLYAPIDPISVVMIGSAEQKHREQEALVQREIENKDIKLTAILDASQVNDS